jgi:glucosyl-dolichyl phosphate glucuronosyltransferase
MLNREPFISIVTPTFRRPREVADLLDNLARQTVLPVEVILVDGAPTEEAETEKVVLEVINNYPFTINYIRHGGGTAIQRNIGIEAAQGDFVALIDDDVRLDCEFLSKIYNVFAEDVKKEVGGVVGFRTNTHFKLNERTRWRWYKRLGLLTVYEPGKYDYQTGYPINNGLQPPFSGVRPVEFMTTACAVWRREVFDAGLRFDRFFSDYGVLEDAHFSLRAGRNWKLLQCGDAHCEELKSPHGRVNRRKVGYKCVVNYYYVFQDIVRPLSFRQKYRFWRYQAFEIFRMATSLIRRRRTGDALEILGRLEGVAAVMRGAATTNLREVIRHNQ